MSFVGFFIGFQKVFTRNSKCSVPGVVGLMSLNPPVVLQEGSRKKVRGGPF